MLAVGVDAYRGGWVAVTLDDGEFLKDFVTATFAELLAAVPTARAVGVDIPIGIPGTYPRPADVAARRFVGARASSVFPTPTRIALEAETYEEALAAQRLAFGVGVSKQAYALRARILEVDRAKDDARVFEVHPEVSFTELAGAPLPSKRTDAGLRLRREHLAAAGINLRSTRMRVPTADLLDAAVAAWSAHRYARGEALPLPTDHRERIGAIWR